MDLFKKDNYYSLDKKCVKQKISIMYCQLLISAFSTTHLAEAWGMRSAEGRNVNVLEMKCLRSLVRVSRMDRVRNEKVRRRAGIEKELASRANQY